MTIAPNRTIPEVPRPQVSSDTTTVGRIRRVLPSDIRSARQTLLQADYERNRLDHTTSDPTNVSVSSSSLLRGLPNPAGNAFITIPEVMTTGCELDFKTQDDPPHPKYRPRIVCP